MQVTDRPDRQIDSVMKLSFWGVLPDVIAIINKIACQYTGRSETIFTLPYCPRSGSRTIQDMTFGLLISEFINDA